MSKIYRGITPTLVLITLLTFGCIGPMGPLPGPGTGGGELSDQTIIAGLKEALAVGTVNAVLNVSKPNGYFGNALIRILLPEQVRQYEEPLRMAGFGPHIDQFMLSMNRAAEKAAPMAKDLFVSSIKQMTFQDARQILFGPDNAATMFFRAKTEQPLTRMFMPIVHSAMSEVGVTREFQKIQPQLTLLSLGRVNVDLDGYVTGRALDGLFLMVAAEERKIRENPAARVTELLRKVFGR